jgi:uncharacterized protein
MSTDTALRRFRQRVPSRWPVGAPLTLLFLAVILRVVDIYVLRLDERLGEIILSKALGFSLVAGYVWWVGRHLSAIGLHFRRLGPALAIGAALIFIAFAIATVVQLLTLDQSQSLTVRMVSSKTDGVGGGAFVGIFIAGNVINSCMEEGLFRGVMLTHFLQRMRFTSANLLQASLFAVWHVVWPIKAYLSGAISGAEAFSQGCVLIFGAFIAGIVFGYLFWRTDSLWAPMIAHFLNNILHSLMQIENSVGDLQPTALLPVIVVVATACLTFGVDPIAARLGLVRLRPWHK